MRTQPPLTAAAVTASIISSGLCPPGTAAMSPRSPLPLGLVAALALLVVGWCGAQAEARAFFGSLFDSFQDAELNNGTTSGLGLLLEALSSLHSGGSFHDLFLGK